MKARLAQMEAEASKLREAQVLLVGNVPAHSTPCIFPSSPSPPVSRLHHAANDHPCA